MKQLQLRELEVPLAKKVAVGLAADGLNIQAVQGQKLQIIVNALAFGGDALGGQVGKHILQCLGVLLVRLLMQKPGEVQQLQLFVGHGAALLSLR